MFTGNNRTRRTGMVVVLVLATFWGIVAARGNEADRIRPYTGNPFYWQYKGKPIMLIGASDKDNLWQWTGQQLTDHLDLMVSVGGNYVRCTMSDRNEGDVYAFKQIEDGLYDLEQWNDEYWKRLTFFLDETAKRNIIVQLTLWDRHDFSSAYRRAEVHPINPANNINWEPGVINDMYHDYYFRSLGNQFKPVLAVQHRYIDKLMSVTLPYGHVLYNIQNESESPQTWDNYWARYIRDKADEQGVEVHVTSMRISPVTSVYQALSNRDLYSFAETSQNNQDAVGATGRKHYENMIRWRRIIASHPQGPMPINNEKVYGEGIGANVAAGTEKEAVERFWRNIFAGAASSRFHRPARRNGSGWGIGLSERAQRTLRSMSTFLEEFDIFRSSPHLECETDGQSVEANYCLAILGEAYAVYFPPGRSTVLLDPWVYVKKVSLRWLDIEANRWSDEQIIEIDWDFHMEGWWGPRRIITLTPRHLNSSVALIRVVEPRSVK